MGRLMVGLLVSDMLVLRDRGAIDNGRLGGVASGRVQDICGK